MKIITSAFLIVAIILTVTISAVQTNGVLEDEPNENLTLCERIEIEKSTIHWLPYKKILVQELADGTVDEDCWERPRAIDEFPRGWWTREERLHGRFLIHIFAAIYLFIILAFICDKYFLPTVEQICVVLKISPDVAASTFMATATTIPEFFANTISTFVADSDMGLSAIIGSIMFNTLGVAACASLFAKKPIQIDWWPITRDSIVFSINITVLVAMSWDGVVMWYETIILVMLYIGYWFLMFQNPRIMKIMKHLVEDKFVWCQRIKNYDIANQRPYHVKPLTEAHVENGTTHAVQSEHSKNGIQESYKSYDNLGFDQEAEYAQAPLPPSSTDLTQNIDGDVEEYKIWEIPAELGKFGLFWYFFTWPIRFMLFYTIPNPAKYQKWFIFPFSMCVIWIGIVSYMIFWMVVIVGDVFNIPEPVMGLTFLAFGGCMPEAISAVIVARKGSGQMGVSNALGANSLAILFSLGVPWFIRTMTSGAGYTGAYIRIFSHGIEFTIMALLLAVATLYVTIAAAGYKLRRTVGGVLAIGYALIATFAILVELDVFFEAPDRC